MEFALFSLATVVIVVIAVIILVPRRVSYTESVTIAASPARVYDAVRTQEELMQWSAWPGETGATCALENADGEIGARTVYFSKGKRFGYQEVVGLEPNRRVDFALFSAGPPQRPRLAFSFQPLSGETTAVTLHWDNVIALPFNLLLRVVGIVRWTREMHLKDLDGLKRYCEPPFQTYSGSPATRVAAAIVALPEASLRSK